MPFLIEGSLLSVGGVIIIYTEPLSFSLKMEKTKLQTFVKCKEMSQNMEFTKFNDDFPFYT